MKTFSADGSVELFHARVGHRQALFVNASARTCWGVLILGMVLLERATRQIGRTADLPGGHSEWEPPDPIPNSEVKPLSADGSVGVPMRE